MTDDLTRFSTTSLAQLIRERQVSSEQVITAHLERIEAVNPALNAVVALNPEARAQARRADEALAQGENLGPLHGVPFTVKEAFAVAGLVSTGGTLGRRSFVSEHDSTVVARVRAAGGIVLGVTNTGELSLAYETDNLVYGRTNNPYDLTHTSGGSAGGEAAIIAAGGSPFGIGADFAGTARIPAHFCGIAALRPTVGRIARTGYFPPVEAMRGLITQPGPMARSVADLALVFPLLVGPDGHDSGVIPVPLSIGGPEAFNFASLRVACYTDNGIAPATPETVSTVQAAAQVLRDLGGTVSEERPPGIEQTLGLLLGLNTIDGGAYVQHHLQAAGTDKPHPSTIGYLENVKAMGKTAADFMDLWTRWDAWRGANLTFMQNYDVVLCPVSATPATPHGTALRSLPTFTYAMTYSLTASPVVVVRAGTSAEGLPIGVQVVAKHWREDVALAVADVIESALGGWQPPPL